MSDHGAIGLATLAIKRMELAPYFEWQPSWAEYHDDLRAVLGFSGPVSEALHCQLGLSERDPAGHRCRTAVVQVLGSTRMFMGLRDKHWVAPSGRFLTRLETVVWRTALTPGEVTRCPELTLHRPRTWSVTLILDRPFEVLPPKTLEDGFICLLMTPERVDQLVEANSTLDSMMDQQMCWDYSFSMGLSKEEARAQQEAQEAAKRMAWKVFEPLSLMKGCLSAVESEEMAGPYLKRRAFTGYPRLVDFERVPGGESLAEFVKAP